MIQACDLPDGFPILSDDILSALDGLNATFEVEQGLPIVTMHVLSIEGNMSFEEAALVNKLNELDVVVCYSTPQ